MFHKPVSRVRVAAMILSFIGLAMAATAIPVAAQTAAVSPAVGREAPSDILLRHVRRLATSPRDFDALIAAGRAALEVGDVQAAIGFFGRADEVYPASALPKAGMGAALVAEGDAAAALPYFDSARQLGASLVLIGKDRGLAYDLLGRHAEAQADYRAAMLGLDGDEARRRLALSLAIIGNKAEAIDQLAPLSARGDPAAARVRALVLALTGDADNARRVLDSRMPGVSAAMDPFFRRLPTLRSDQKAAAVHLGIFPGTESQSGSAVAGTGTAGSTQNRIGAIDEWLRRSVQPPAAPQPQQPAQVAAATPSVPRPAATQPERRSAVTTAAGSMMTYSQQKIWLQLASGRDAQALPEQFRRIKNRNRDLLEGISGYVVETAERSRLLIGPFKDKSDADLFADTLATERVSAFSWTSPAGQAVRKLGE